MKEFVDSIHPVGTWKNTEPILIPEHLDKPLLLFFWRAHTPESVHTLHELNELVASQGPLPVDVLAVHAPEYDPHDQVWEEIISHFNITLPVFHDPHFHTWERFGVHHAPSYIILDSTGKEMHRRAGSLQDSGIQDIILSIKK